MAEYVLVQTNAGLERSWQRSKLRQTPIIKLTEYDVYLNGVVIGRVWRGLATFERKTAGRVYVNSRWQSPRWFAETTAGPDNPYRSPYASRAQALRALTSILRRQSEAA